ncbi:MAG: SRPBCC domain-containing protein, partial [Candidatus Cybelea sp.]
MNLEWSGQERITASKEKVWSFINDPTSIASCLPDVRQTNVLDAHTFDATVGVAVGPVRGSFKFKIALEPRPDGN